MVEKKQRDIREDNYLKQVWRQTTPLWREENKDFRRICTTIFFFNSDLFRCRRIWCTRVMRRNCFVSSKSGNTKPTPPKGKGTECPVNTVHAEKRYAARMFCDFMDID